MRIFSQLSAEKNIRIDNAVLKIWPESEETNGEYASAIRSFKHNLDIQKIHINFDIKDTIERPNDI